MAAATSDQPLKQYTLKDVAAHNTIQTSWIVLHGKVYDVTKFLEDHPGGDQVLLDNAGKDGTSNFEDIGHSDEAKKQLKQFLIGEIKEQDNASEKKNVQAVASSSKTSDKKPESGGGFPLFILPLVFALAGITYYWLSSSS